jgi:hypothetical protein
MCAHKNQTDLRLISDTRYGPMFGCLACGTSWLVREADEKRASTPSQRSPALAQGRR